MFWWRPISGKGGNWFNLTDECRVFTNWHLLHQIWSNHLVIAWVKLRPFVNVNTSFLLLIAEEKEWQLNLQTIRCLGERPKPVKEFYCLLVSLCNDRQLMNQALSCCDTQTSRFKMKHDSSLCHWICDSVVNQ